MSNEEVERLLSFRDATTTSIMKLCGIYDDYSNCIYNAEETLRWLKEKYEDEKDDLKCYNFSDTSDDCQKYYAMILKDFDNTYEEFVVSIMEYENEKNQRLNKLCL